MSPIPSAQEKIGWMALWRGGRNEGRKEGRREGGVKEWREE